MQQLFEFMLHHWELWSALCILLILLFIYEVQSQKLQGIKISPQEMVMLMNQKAIVLDIRSPEQFANGHIIHSTHIHKTDVESKSVAKHKKQPVILVCQRGNESQSIAPQWRQAGYEHVKVLAGGMDAWKDAGFPLIKLS